MNRHSKKRKRKKEHAKSGPKLMMLPTSFVCFWFFQSKWPLPTLLVVTRHAVRLGNIIYKINKINLCLSEGLNFSLYVATGCYFFYHFYFCKANTNLNKVVPDTFRLAKHCCCHRCMAAGRETILLGKFCFIFFFVLPASVQ